MKVRVIGAGLAGVEASNYLANKGFQVELYEMRPAKNTEAHKTDKFGELVCSNSLKSEDLLTASGVMKKEMEMLDSLVLKIAKKNRLDAGTALAVDRENFSKDLTDIIKNNKNIKIINEEYKAIDPTIPTIIATGPLTSNELYNSLKEEFDNKNLYFYDAQAPIIYRDSIDMNICYKKNRYDKGEASYINCPFTKEEFEIFYNYLINAEEVEIKDFELKVFESCMPVEIMAKRGEKTLLFGPMKPVGLMKPDGTKPYAVVQLREDDAAKTLYNLVGFQTHLTFKAQKELLKLIPGLKDVVIAKYGRMHKNIYLNSGNIINKYLQTKKYENIFIAGQVSGVEGYMESALTGIVAAINLERFLNKREMIEYPNTTITGVMIDYITNEHKDFQPINANFGILPFIDTNKKQRKEEYSKRAIKDFKETLDKYGK